MGGRHAGRHTQLISQIFQAFFYADLANLPELVRTGRLDFLLLQPIDAQFAVSTKQFGADNLVNAVIGIAFVVTSLVKLNITPTVTQVILYAWLIATGRGHPLLHLSQPGHGELFHRARAGAYLRLLQPVQSRALSRCRLSGMFKFVFSWVIPIIVVTNIPTRLLIRLTDSPVQLMLQLVLAALIVITASRLFWMMAVRRYSSASS